MRISRVRLAHPTTLVPFRHFIATVVSYAEGLVYLEPKGDISANYNVRMVNGGAELSADKPFHIFLRNLSKVERQLPKGMVISHEIESPLTLLTIGGYFGIKLALFVNIPSAGEHTQLSQRDTKNKKKKDYSGETAVLDVNEHDSAVE